MTLSPRRISCVRYSCCAYAYSTLVLILCKIYVFHGCNIAAISELVEIATGKWNQKVSLEAHTHTHLRMCATRIVKIIKSHRARSEREGAKGTHTQFAYSSFDACLEILSFVSFFCECEKPRWILYNVHEFVYQNSNERKRKYLTNDERWIIQQMSRLPAYAFANFRQIIIIWKWYTAQEFAHRNHMLRWQFANKWQPILFFLCFCIPIYFWLPLFALDFLQLSWPNLVWTLHYFSKIRTTIICDWLEILKCAERATSKNKEKLIYYISMIGKPVQKANENERQKSAGSGLFAVDLIFSFSANGVKQKKEEERAVSGESEKAFSNRQ